MTDNDLNVGSTNPTFPPARNDYRLADLSKWALVWKKLMRRKAVDNQERARKWLEFSPVWPVGNATIASLAAELDAVAKEAVQKFKDGTPEPTKPEGKPTPADWDRITQTLEETSRAMQEARPEYKPQWEPGQMLIDSRPGHRVVRLVRSPIEQDFGWRYEVWMNDHWEFARGVGLPYSLETHYEPYPRVGDWVKCTNRFHDHGPRVYRVGAVSKDGAFCGAITPSECKVADLEPASPPVGESSDITNPDSGLGYHVPAQHAKPTLEGPHWDKVVNYANRELPDFVCIAVLDLREAVREHEKRVAEALRHRER